MALFYLLSLFSNILSWIFILDSFTSQANLYF
jgi:hypothetical protein